MPEGKPITIEPYPNQVEIKLDGYTIVTIVLDEHTRASDAHMLASPTIDQTLTAKMQSKAA